MISPDDDTLHSSSGAVGEHVRTRSVSRQRSARTDPSMRDGDSSHGNPYETDPDDLGTDHDVGDAIAESVGSEEALPIDADDPEAQSSRSVNLPNAEAAVVPTADMTSTGAVRRVMEDDEDDATAVAEEATGAWNHAAAAEADHEDRSDENNRAIRAERPQGGSAGRRGTRQTPAPTHGRHTTRRAEERPTRPAEVGLPIEGYRDLTVPEILERVFRMPISQAREVQRYEGSHLRRKTLLVKLERYLRDKRDEPAGPLGTR